VLALLLVTNCGESDPSLTSYVESLNAMDAEFSPRGEATWTAYLAIPAPTIDDLRTMQDEILALRIDVENAFAELEAPQRIAGMHSGFAAWHSRLLTAEREQTARAATAGSIEEFLESAEVTAWTIVLGEGSVLCDEVEGRLNATEASDFFAGTPWMPSDLTAAVHAAIGCQNFPNDLNDVAKLYGG